jgi:hypothetical protein
MTDAPLAAPRRSRRRTTLKVWTVLLLILVGLACFALLVDLDRRREQAGWNAVREKVYFLKWSIGVSDRPTYDAIAARFTPDNPPATQPHSEGVTFRATFDGRTFGPQFEGWTVTMTFLDNRTGPAPWNLLLADDRQAHGRLLYLTARPPRTYRSTPTPLWYHVQTGRRVAIAVAAIAWAAAAMLLFVAGPWRRAVAQVCVAAALVAATAWLLDPRYDWARWGDDRVLKLIAAGMGFSLLMVVLPTRRRRVGHARCTKCGYDLTGNESGICPECGTVTLAFLDTQRHAESARLALPLASVPLVYGPEPDAFVVVDDVAEDGDNPTYGESVPNSDEESPGEFGTAGHELSATGPA